jgi:D-sedoheptulose 7-phosphate isomerase
MLTKDCPSEIQTEITGEPAMNFVESFLAETRDVLIALDIAAIEECVRSLSAIRERGGRLFILGVGGSAANASHAVNDFRKICQFESYCATENVAELTARMNDDGWQSTFLDWLVCSRLCPADGILVFSVGGGNLQKNISTNLIPAVRHAKKIGAAVLGVLGRRDGFVAAEADVCVLLPEGAVRHLTPQAEILQVVILHLFATHPLMQVNGMKWERTS